MTKHTSATLTDPGKSALTQLSPIVNRIHGHATKNKWLIVGATILLCLLILWNALYSYLLIIDLNDFGKFYHSILAYLDGDGLYGPNEETLTRESPLFFQHHWNLNPPHFHLLFLPLGWVSTYWALGIWVFFSILSLWISIRILFKEIGIRPTPWGPTLFLLAILAFAGTGFVIVSGQLSFFLLLPITLAWVRARQHKWIESGIWMGLTMSVKPFLMIFLPYYIFNRRWKSLTVALGTCLSMFGFGIYIFGLPSYVSWVEVLGLINWSWFSNNASLLGLWTRLLNETPLFAPLYYAPQYITLFWLVSIGCVGALTLQATRFDQSKADTDRNFALLLTAAMLISPLGWLYYLFLALGPLLSLMYTNWSKQNNPTEFEKSKVLTIRNIFFFAMIPGFLIPTVAGGFFQPSPVATLFLASAYFWSTFFLWTGLIVDWRVKQKTTTVT